MVVIYFVVVFFGVNFSYCDSVSEDENGDNKVIYKIIGYFSGVR